MLPEPGGAVVLRVNIRSVETIQWYKNGIALKEGRGRRPRQGRHHQHAHIRQAAAPRPGRQGLGGGQEQVGQGRDHAV